MTKRGESIIPVLEIGGTHVTAALVADAAAKPSLHRRRRIHLESSGGAESIMAQLVSAAKSLEVDAALAWGVAIPGPFDYTLGIGSYEGVQKFDSLNGYPLGTALTERIHPQPSSISFINDADAFGIGEWVAGAGRGHERMVGLTLGTGIGSAFISKGAPIDDGPEVPAQGSAHLLSWNGSPIEDVVSRRSIRRRYQESSGVHLDVHEIAERARDGDSSARGVIDHTMIVLGETIAPWLDRFDATVLVVGGSISGSWDLLEQPLREGIARVLPQQRQIMLLKAELPEDAPLIGAAYWAATRPPKAPSLAQKP